MSRQSSQSSRFSGSRYWNGSRFWLINNLEIILDHRMRLVGDISHHQEVSIWSSRRNAAEWKDRHPQIM
jgi:hypothetical protein